MKSKLQKLYNLFLGLIPVCATICLTSVVNSTITWGRGQDELPVGAKKYRKF